MAEKEWVLEGVEMPDTEQLARWLLGKKRFIIPLRRKDGSRSPSWFPRTAKTIDVEFEPVSFKDPKNNVLFVKGWIHHGNVGLDNVFASFNYKTSRVDVTPHVGI